MGDVQGWGAERKDDARRQVESKPSQPILIEAGVSVSTGGKVQLKKFELSADYHFSVNGKWSVPPGWTADEAEMFRHEQVLRLRKELEVIAQAELDDLLDQKNAIAQGD